MKSRTKILRYFLPGRKYFCSFQGNKKTLFTMTFMSIFFYQEIFSHPNTVNTRPEKMWNWGTTPAVKYQAKSKNSPFKSHEEELKKGELGFRFLPTFASLEFQTIDKGIVHGEATLGYGIGGMLAVNFTNHTGVQVEVLYNSLSQKYKDRELEKKINIEYLNIPVLFSLNSDKAKLFNVNFVAGPQWGYNLGSRVETMGGSNNNEPDTVQAVLAIKKGDFGFAYGAGLEFKMNEQGTLRFDMGYRGVYGLIKINDNSSTRETESYYILEKTRIRTHAIYFGLTCLF